MQRHASRPEQKNVLLAETLLVASAVMMSPDAILSRFKNHLGVKTDAAVARQLGVSRERLAMWRLRKRVPASGIGYLLRQAAVLGVPLAAEDFFPQDEHASADEPAQSPFVGTLERAEQGCAEEAA
jgi:transcriptional regulator with XRE-family HTH domain